MGAEHSTQVNDDWQEDDTKAISLTRREIPGMTAMPRSPFAQWPRNRRVTRSDSNQTPLPSSRPSRPSRPLRPPPTKQNMKSPTEEQRSTQKKQDAQSKQRRRQERFAKQKELLENRAELDRVNQELESVLDEKRRRQLQKRAKRYRKTEQGLLEALRPSPDHQPPKRWCSNHFPLSSDSSDTTTRKSRTTAT